MMNDMPPMRLLRLIFIFFYHGLPLAFLCFAPFANATGYFFVNVGDIGLVLPLSNGEGSSSLLSTPTHLKATYPGNAIGLIWQANPEPDLVSYKIYKNGLLLTTVPANQLSYTDSEVTHGSSYSYQLSAVDAAGLESCRTDTINVTADFVPPQVNSLYPEDGAAIYTNGESLSLIVVFSDEGSGVASVQLFDEDDNELTQRAKVTSNSIELCLVDPGNGTHTYTLYVTDFGENTLRYQFSFEVDSTPLKTTASIPGGEYSNPQTITLTSSKAATIYYSLDGYPPLIGVSPSGSSPITGIEIAKNTSLQFFAVTQDGYQETTKNEVYVFSRNLVETTGLNAASLQEPTRINLSWQPVASTEVIGYEVYRCDNQVECSFLIESRDGKYPPPDQFKISAVTLTSTSFMDNNITIGARYSYGVLAITQDNSPGRLSALASVSVTSAQKAANRNEAIGRATAWLEASQDITGYWGNKVALRLLATSQVLNGLKPVTRSDASINRALYYLRGQNANNNDFLARQILSLSNYQKNVDQQITRLVSQADFNQTDLAGWGMTAAYKQDALSTALGLMASKKTAHEIANNQSANRLLSDPSLWSSEGQGRYSWIPGAETSIFVSSLVYHALAIASSVSPPDADWIYNKQNGDGSFGKSLLDTVAVLLWLNPNSSARENAERFVLANQDVDGSWGQDAYVTGLCLEALSQD